MNEQEVLALAGLLNYSWYEEYVNYLCCVSKNNHVYNRIAVLLELLFRVDETILKEETVKMINDLKTDVATVMLRDSMTDYILN